MREGEYMTTQYIAEGLLREERETLINCTINEDGSFEWIAKSSIPAHIAKLKKAGRKPTGQLIARSSGSVQSMTFKTNNPNPISFRDLAKPKRTVSEEERERRRQRMKEMRNQQTNE
jgi:hypothetical protein